MYAIRREKRKLNAWCWIVQFTRRGRLYSKYFYDGKHGGKVRAFNKAVKWRDDTLAKLSPVTKLEFHKHRRTNNTSGVPGVHYLQMRDQPLGLWQAKIVLAGGTKVHKNFAVLKHGNRRAFNKAVAARKEMLKMVEDRPYLKHPTARRLTAKSITKRI